jgi:hypothetical protein
VVAKKSRRGLFLFDILPLLCWFSVYSAIDRNFLLQLPVAVRNHEQQMGVAGSYLCGKLTIANVMFLVQVVCSRATKSRIHPTVCIAKKQSNSLDSLTPTALPI